MKCLIVLNYQPHYNLVLPRKQVQLNSTRWTAAFLRFLNCCRNAQSLSHLAFITPGADAVEGRGWGAVWSGCQIPPRSRVCLECGVLGRRVFDLPLCSADTELENSVSTDGLSVHR